MADGDNTPPENPQNPPAGSPPKDQGGISANTSEAEKVELAKKLGEAEAKVKILEEYQQKVEPVLETIWKDEELLKTTTEKHNKRLGIKIEDKDDGKEGQSKIEPSKIEKDNRNFAISQTVGQFNTTHGFDKMTKEQQADFNQRVGMALQEMLDPMGNKNLQQIMEDVSVTKLPKFLDNAYHLAFKDEIVSQAKEEAKKEVQENNLGMIGSMPSTSVDTEQITLTAKEKETCRKAGWDEAKYLENKKQLAQKGNQLFS